ncbi:MAG: carbohydrate ABC transporter permease [Geminicoccaceae bacterium]|nr:carbohydrate ABC transporter permease [Geminicoccaceae bacterium]
MARWLVFALCGVWLLFTVFPVYWTVVTAFKSPPAVFDGPTYVPWYDFTPSLRGVREVLSGERGDVLRPLLNSTLIGFTATALATLLGSMAAYALVRFEMRIRLVAALVFVAAGIGGYLGLDHAGWSDGGAMGGALLVALATSVPANRIPFPGKVFANADIAFWFISQRMFPPIVSAFALYLLYARLGRDGFQLLDTFWGMTLCYTAFVLPVVVWLMRDFFRSLPVAVEEAALVDDVPRWRIFLEIVLPMSRGGLVATFLISLGFVWNEFLFALILTSSKWQTMPIMISGQNSVRGTEWWSISAAALVAILPMMIATWFIARMMRSGIALGGLK